MFTLAFEKVTGFTRPIVTAWVNGDGTTHYGASSMVLVNNQGYFVTAAHIFRDGVDKMTKAVRDWASAHAQHEAIQADPKLKHKDRKRQLRAMKLDEAVKD